MDKQEVQVPLSYAEALYSKGLNDSRFENSIYQYQTTKLKNFGYIALALFFSTLFLSLNFIIYNGNQFSKKRVLGTSSQQQGIIKKAIELNSDDYINIANDRSNKIGSKLDEIENFITINSNNSSKVTDEYVNNIKKNKFTLTETLNNIFYAINSKEGRNLSTEEKLIILNSKYD